jgi:hypothetical protein
VCRFCPREKNFCTACSKTHHAEPESIKNARIGRK